MTESDIYPPSVPPLPPRYRFRDLIWGDHAFVEDDSHRIRRKSNALLTRNINQEKDADQYERVRVEFFTNEKSFKERLQLYFIKNQRSSLRIRTFNLFIKLLSCALYIVRVVLDDPEPGTCYKQPFGPCYNVTRVEDQGQFDQDPSIRWGFLIWVNRAYWLWIIQVTVAGISLIETLLLTYLGYKGNILQQIINFSFIFEVINTVPFIITIFYVPIRSIFIPVFLNCWLAKVALENMLNDLHRAMQRSQSALSQQLLILAATLICFVFTCMCGIQHLQRGGNQQMDLVNSLWFVIVTFSTVGYGDIYPDIWPSKCFMMIMIASTFIVLPTQFEQLAFTMMERQKQGGTYSSHRAQNEKHVVVCSTTLHTDAIMDFLNEFYAHPKLQDYYVVLLSPCELDPTVRMILHVPLWAARVIYIQGSALKDTDLSRCRMQDAEACFILAARSYLDRTAADQHTILRSWAVKDFAPGCPQYVQIFRPENKFHVKFAEHCVCEDEFKYALLANNCLCPGASTLVTLLLHTSRGAEGQTSSEDWMKLYGKCSGNEIYHIKLGDSQFFGEYEGKSFTYASFHAHRKYGVSLVGVKQDRCSSAIQLNPGPRHIMKATDLCFYMNITKEENSAFILAHPNPDKERMGSVRRKSTANPDLANFAGMIAGTGTIALEMQRPRHQSETEGPTMSEHLELPKGLNVASLSKRPSIAPVPAVLEANGIEITVESEPESEEVIVQEDKEDMPWMTPVPDYVKGFPPTPPYIHCSPRLCHLLRTSQPLCCLQLEKACEHCSFKHAKEYNWPNRAIIVAADFASNGLYNFIVPLRSHARPKNTLNPIVLLLEKPPDTSFLECICYFPMVYWMIGSIDCLDHLLKAGINLADNVVIVNRESSNSAEEDSLCDCNTIVAVQTIFRMFPNANIITELSQASNMRFMQFRAKDSYSQTISKLERKERERGSHLYYMFRLPFAAGNVFSASMLDTLLYQAFVKDYLITFVRLLLGIDQAVGSGHLSCMKITKEDLWIRTYGRLYQKLCSTTCEVPIGLYRTETHVKAQPSEHQSHSGLRRLSSLRHSFRRNGSFRSSFKGKDENAQAQNSKEESRSTKDSKAKRNGYLRVDTRESSDVSNLQRCRPPKLMVSLSDEEQSPTTGLSIERQEISQMVKCRMASMGLPLEDYDEVSDKRNSRSFTVINPSYDLKLEIDDIIYLIRPSSLSPQASPLIDERKRFMKREEPTGADKDTTETSCGVPLSSQEQSIQMSPTEEPCASTDNRSQLTSSKGIRGTIV